MAELPLPQAIARFKGNELRIDDFTNGNAAGYYTTIDGKKVETLPGLVARLTAAIAAASAVRKDLAGSGGAALIGYGDSTAAAALEAQQKTLDQLRANQLPKTGGTLSGPLRLAAAPTETLQPATKGYTDDLIATCYQPQVGAVVRSLSAPNSDWIPDDATYLQSAYPKLFEKLGFVDYDNSMTPWSNAAYLSSRYNFIAIGKDGVLLTLDYISGVQYILRSSDNGSTFEKINPPYQSIRGGATDGNGLWILACSSGRLLRSLDNARSWSIIESGIGNDLNTIATDKAGRWIATSSSGLAMRSIDNGVTWEKVTTNTNNYSGISIATNAKGTWIIGSYNGQHFHSTDHGLTWKSNTPLNVGGYAVNTWTSATYAAGFFCMTGFSNYYSWQGAAAFSLDGINWKTVALNNNSASQNWNIALGNDGTCIITAYTQGAFKTTLSVDSAGSISWPAFSSVPTAIYPVPICTDGFGTWITQSWNTNQISRALPAYDLKTLFRAPKSFASLAPFTNFIKAR